MGRPKKDEPHWGPVGTVKVSQGLLRQVDAKIGGMGRRAEVIGPVLEPWVAREFDRVPTWLSLLSKDHHRIGKLTFKADATLRLPKWTVRRLGIISAVSDRLVGEIVEELLRNWIQTGTPALSEQLLPGAEKIDRLALA